MFIKIFIPNLEVVAISDLPGQEYLDCGYWTMFYFFFFFFVIYHLLGGMSQIKEAIPFTSKYFKSIKNTIRNYYIEACGQAERIMEECNKNKNDFY